MGLKGLHVSIYRDSDPCDCTMGGVSSVAHGRTALTVVDDRIAGVFEADEEAPAVELVRREIGGQTYVHAKPYGETRHTMFGGNFLHTSDSRLREATGTSYPIPIHDRIEF